MLLFRPPALALAIISGLSPLAFGFGFANGHFDRLVVGDTINLRWTTGKFEKFISLTLGCGFCQADGIILATNISNTGSFAWTVPRDIPSAFISGADQICLSNYEIEEIIFCSDWFNIYRNFPTSLPTSAGQFTWPTGLPKGVRLGDSWNVTWEFPGSWVNLSVASPYNEASGIMSTRPNTGSFQWNVELRGYHTDPHWLVLRSNDSAYTTEYIRSDVYYVEPGDYDSKQSSYTPGPQDRIIYPAGDPMPVFRINDTVVVEWTPGPLFPKLATVGKRKLASAISDPLAGGAVSYEWVLHYTEGMYSTWPHEIAPGKYRLNLYDTPSRGADLSNDKLLYKSPEFEIKSASGSPTTWRATVTTPLSTGTTSNPTASQGLPSTSIARKQRLSKGGKAGIGVGVGVFVVAIAVGVVIVVRRRVKREENLAGVEGTSEMGGVERVGVPIESDVRDERRG